MVPDCSLLHLALCGERPLFLRALHQAGYQVEVLIVTGSWRKYQISELGSDVLHQVAVVATMFKITPVQDAVRSVQCSGGR